MDQFTGNVCTQNVDVDIEGNGCTQNVDVDIEGNGCTQNVDVDIEFLDEVIHAAVINKLVIGKVIVKYCGNEGTQNDERTTSLRKLLQAVLDYWQTTDNTFNWKNAEITIYDIDDNSFCIISGQGKHQFVVSDDGYGNPEIVNIANKVQKVKQNKDSKQYRHRKAEPYSTDRRQHHTSSQNKSYQEHNGGINTQHNPDGKPQCYCALC